MRKLSFIFMVFSILMLMTATAWAKDPATPELTFQQALDRAKSQSEALKSSQYDIDKGEKVRDHLQTKMLFAPTSPTTVEAERWFTSYVQSDLNWEMAKRSYGAQEDILVMQTYQTYDGLLQALEKVKVTEAQLKNAEWKNRVAGVSYKVGMLDKMGLIQAGAAVEMAKSDHESAREALNDTYQKFNQLVGLWPEDRPVLVDNPSFEKIKIDNLDVEVERAVVASPNVWLSQKQINLAKLTLDLYDLTSINNIEPYSAKKYDVDKAKISAADTEEQTRILVRTIYYKVVQLEEQYASAQERLTVAEESLRVARVKYEVGVSTQSDVLGAETDLALAKQALIDIASQHEILSFAFRKPWAYAGASGASSSGSASQGGSY